jgi:hypothetical protein
MKKRNRKKIKYYKKKGNEMVRTRNEERKNLTRKWKERQST